MTEDEQRQKFIEEALSWKGTPHRDCARVKGAGVDCLTFLAECAIACGLVPKDVEIPDYSPQWHLHRNVELYLNGMKPYTREITFDQIKPADIAVWKYGRCFSHAAIIIDYPRIIHCVKDIGVHEDDAVRNPMLRFNNDQPRPVRYFSMWGR